MSLENIINTSGAETARVQMTNSFHEKKMQKEFCHSLQEKKKKKGNNLAPKTRIQSENNEKWKGKTKKQPHLEVPSTGNHISEHGTKSQTRLSFPTAGRVMPILF